MRTSFAGKTDVGLLRDRNEDSFLVFPQYRFAAVADGMGGHLSGDVASALAISTLMEFYRHTVGPDRTWPFPYDNDLTEEENCVVVGVRLANQHVFSRARRSQNESGMGTTIVAVMFTPGANQVIVGHVGDSRCYRVRDGHITQLTSDHSLVSEVTEIAPWLSEEEVNQLPSNVITRALGMAPDVVVDLLTTEVRAGDQYLLCSDGLNGMLTDEEILDIVESSADLDVVCGQLVSRANAAGGNDNTTVVVVQVEADDVDDDADDDAADDAADDEGDARDVAADDEGEDPAADDDAEGDADDDAEGDGDAEASEAEDAGAADEPVDVDDTLADTTKKPASPIKAAKGSGAPIAGGAIELIEQQGGLEALLED